MKNIQKAIKLLKETIKNNELTATELIDVAEAIVRLERVISK